jgi:hypothetical protein
MPVSVSLELLVATPGTRALWPAEFAGLIDQLEEEPTDANQWLIIADWIDDHAEKEFASTFRWFANNEAVFTEKSHYVGWTFKGLPKCIEAEPIGDNDRSTLAGATAGLCQRLRRVREAVS